MLTTSPNLHNFGNFYLCLQHSRAELHSYYCISKTATRVQLRLQAASFDTYWYAGGWRLEERELTSSNPHISVLIKFVELYLSWFSLFIYFYFWVRSFPFTNIQVTCQPRPGFWSYILQYLCLIKSTSIQKFLMTSLRVICSLALLPNQKSWLRLYVPSQCFSKL